MSCEQIKSIMYYLCCAYRATSRDTTLLLRVKTPLAHAYVDNSQSQGCQIFLGT
jgi:hypothetical protein